MMDSHSVSSQNGRSCSLLLQASVSRILSSLWLRATRCTFRRTEVQLLQHAGRVTNPAGVTLHGGLLTFQLHRQPFHPGLQLGKTKVLTIQGKCTTVYSTSNTHVNYAYMIPGAPYNEILTSMSVKASCHNLIVTHRVSPPLAPAWCLHCPRHHWHWSAASFAAPLPVCARPCIGTAGHKI